MLEFRLLGTGVLGPGFNAGSAAVMAGGYNEREISKTVHICEGTGAGLLRRTSRCRRGTAKL